MCAVRELFFPSRRGHLRFQVLTVHQRGSTLSSCLHQIEMTGRGPDQTAVGPTGPHRHRKTATTKLEIRTLGACDRPIKMQDHTPNMRPATGRTSPDSMLAMPRRESSRAALHPLIPLWPTVFVVATKPANENGYQSPGYTVIRAIGNAFYWLASLSLSFSTISAQAYVTDLILTHCVR